MALLQSEATAEELLASLPHRLHHVIRPWAESSPSQPALIGDGKRWTYGELPGIVENAAAEQAAWRAAGRSRHGHWGPSFEYGACECAQAASRPPQDEV